jgi:phage-related protein
MYNYFLWNGISSLQYGWVKETPFPTASMMQFEYTTIPNRSTPLATCKNIRDTTSISFELQLKNRQGYESVYSWLNGGNAQGTLIVSDDVTKYYNATCTNVSPNYMNYNISSINIEFTCEPFRYSVDNNPIVINGSTSIEVGGNYYSEPKIKVYGNGNGNLIVNGGTLALYVSEYLTIDTGRLLAYKDNVVALSQTAGDLPRFQVGMNTISFNGSITSPEVYKNERWL